jgi:hypothetical protein
MFFIIACKISKDILRTPMEYLIKSYDISYGISYGITYGISYGIS